MAAISGVWTFNETLKKRPEYGAASFISNGIEYTGMTEGLSVGAYVLKYLGATVNVYSYATNTWTDEIYRTVDFGTTSQTVSDEFYTWLTANAVQQSSGPSEPETDILYTVYGSSLTAVANAIRGKTGKADPLTLEQMATGIEGIEAGGGKPVFESMLTDKIANHIVSVCEFVFSGILEDTTEE